jgi:homoserine kinase
MVYSATIPATSANLGPGFDTLGLALQLYNRSVVKRSKFFSLSIRGEGRENVKLKNNNLFVNIFNYHYKRLTGKRDYFSFTFHNDIPLSRGLGSSSATIMSALALAYEAAGVKYTKSELLSKALYYESHPDNITPALCGGFTASLVDRSRVRYIKKSIGDEVKAVVVIPDHPMSTAHSRSKLPEVYTKEDTIFNVGHSSLLTAAFLSKNWDMLRIASKDRMHQSYRMNNYRELFKVQKVALDNGALMSTLSGSGSTFFNMAYRDDAQRLFERFEKEFPKFGVKVLDFDNNGLVTKK